MNYSKLNIRQFLKVTIILLILISSLSGYSKEFSYRDHSNLIGTKASNISGYGIYYSKCLSENYRLQGMGIIYYYEWSKGEEKRTIINYDIGLEIQRFIYNGNNMRTYILAGGYYYFDDDTETITNTNKIQIINHSYNIGIGLGFEFYYKRLVFNIDLGYKFFEDNLKTYINGDYEYPTLERTTKLGAGLGMGFMF